MPRLFTGVELPPDVALDLSIMRGGIEGARWIDPESYHVTLRFVGDIPERMAHDLSNELSRVVAMPPFTISLAGMVLTFFYNYVLTNGFAVMGGAGADTFNTFADAGIDRVLDFSFAAGDRVRVEPGSAFTTAQSGADQRTEQEVESHAVSKVETERNGHQQK